MRRGPIPASIAPTRFAAIPAGMAPAGPRPGIFLGIGMWTDLLAAVALMLVIEGIWPFLNPRHLREALLQIVALDDRALRILGLVSMMAGVILLYLVR